MNRLSIGLLNNFEALRAAQVSFKSEIGTNLDRADKLAAL